VRGEPPVITVVVDPKLTVSYVVTGIQTLEKTLGDVDGANMGQHATWYDALLHALVRIWI
jgi:hypothetical protein